MHLLQTHCTLPRPGSTSILLIHPPSFLRTIRRHLAYPTQQSSSATIEHPREDTEHIYPSSKTRESIWEATTKAQERLRCIAHMGREGDLEDATTKSSATTKETIIGVAHRQEKEVTGTWSTVFCIAAACSSTILSNLIVGSLRNSSATDAKASDQRCWARFPASQPVLSDFRISLTVVHRHATPKPSCHRQYWRLPSVEPTPAKYCSACSPS